MDEYLLKCLEDTLSKLPKIVYLKDVINEVLDYLVLNDIICIVVSYFFKCFDCGNYFDELNVRYCHCTDSKENKYYRCKFCARTRVHKDYCNNCVKDINLDKIEKNYLPQTCVVSGCDNIAHYGSVTQSLCCTEHANSGLFISHSRICYNDSCCNSGIYSDGYSSFCSLHKTVYSKLFIVEHGIIQTCEYTQVCFSCNKTCLVAYNCSCNKIRCSDCACAEMFVIYLNKDFASKPLNFCNRCIGEFNFLSAYKCVYMSDTQCNVYGCNKSSKYYDHTNRSFYCTSHTHSSCTYINNRCSYKTCFAIRFSENAYCEYHIKLCNTQKN